MPAHDASPNAPTTPALFIDDAMAHRVFAARWGAEPLNSVLLDWSVAHRYVDHHFQREFNEAVEQVDLNPDCGFARDQACSKLQDRFWELHVGAEMKRSNLDLESFESRRIQHNDPCPDFMFRIGANRFWGECTCVRAGEGPDAVPQPEPSPTPQVVDVPDRQLRLRLTAAIANKLEVFRRYADKGVVDSKDGIVLFVNGRNVGSASVEGSPHRIACVVYGVGHPVATFDCSANKVTDWHLSGRKELFKTNGSPVSTSIFNDDEYRVISAVVFSRVDPFNYTCFPNSSLLVCHNHNATNPIPKGFAPGWSQYSYLPQTHELKFEKAEVTRKTGGDTS